jgi:hypothetical protein
VNDNPLQTTKRELHAMFTSPAMWTGLVAAGVILGLSGPFGTDEVLGPVPRLAYWLVVSAIGFLLGSSVATFTADQLEARGSGKWPASIVAGLLAGCANLMALVVVNWLVFRLPWGTPGYLTVLGPNVIVISLVITLAAVAIGSQTRPAADTPAETAPQPPRILDRLPLDKRGPLIALSVQDHYVQVSTTKGNELILLRLSDAMAEVGDTPGLQVHRSHWVAIPAVKSTRRDGARAILTMANGMDIPVSRTYLPAIKEAGLLPR